MRPFHNSRRTSLWLAAAALECATVLILRAAAADEPVKERVGVVEGDAIAVTGPMSVSVVDGKVKTVLRSGGEVRVKSGRATIELVEGGKIAICGPAHLSVLKSARALTVALDSGTIHTYVDQEPSLTIYTALLQARPLSIGGAPQDTLVGLDAQGGLSVRAIAGAVRIEQQLTGQSIIVPQNSDVLLGNGQLNDMKPGSGRAACELGDLKSEPPPPQVSVPATADEVKQRRLNDPKPNIPSNSKAAPDEGPIYQVFLPPMRYDANLKVQQPPDPNLIVLVRRVRVRPTLIFEGRVEGDALVAENHGLQPLADSPKPAQSQPAAQTKPSPPNPSVSDRVRTFFKRLWGSKS